MDSITQASLGAAVAGVIAGKQCKPKVLLVGALLGTLPDLDIFIRYNNPISNMVNHRLFTHSLFILFPFSLLLAMLYRRYVKDNSFSFKRAWFIIAGCLLTHPLLDSLNTYGTQLFWPFGTIVKISSMSIIDPLYTGPLLLMITASLVWKDKMAKLCGIGLIISSCYLVWSVIASHTIKQRVETIIQGTPLSNKPILITPTSFNTILWRVVIVDGETYYEGLTSLLDSKVNGKYEINLIPKQKGKWLLKNKSKRVKMLEKFTGEFVRYEPINNQLVMTVLQMGMGEYFPFTFAVANLDKNNQWQLINPIRLQMKSGRYKQLPSLWPRLLGNQDIDNILLGQNPTP